MKKTANTSRWRGPGLCILASLLLAGFSTPLIQIWIAQLQSMTPKGVPVEPAVLNALHAALAAEQKIFTVRAAFRELNTKNASPPLDRYRQLDADNGLYGYLELLPRLRQLDPQPTTQPRAPDEALLNSLRHIKLESPASLYLSRQRETAEKFLRTRMLSSRTSALEAGRVSQRFGNLSEYHRPVLRELADRLISLGTGWRTAQHPKEALLAHAAVIRLFSDLSNDSPTPDVVLLAAEKLPMAMNELAQDAKVLGIDINADAQAGGEDISHLVRQWHQKAETGGVSIIPHNGDFALAPVAHDAVTRSLLAESLIVAVWLTLLGVILLLGLIALLTHRTLDAQPMWQLRGWRCWLAPLVVISPLAIAIMIVGSALLPLTWLFTLKSVVPGLLVPLAVLFCLSPSNRLAVHIEGRSDARVPARVIGIVIGVMILTVAVAWLLPVHHDSWRPPIVIQRFRKLGVLLAAECVLFLVAWFVWGQIRRRRARWPMSFPARINLQVASRALLLASVLSIVMLTINRSHDDRHQEAFARALADPLADRLGANWRQEYFSKIQTLLQRAE